MLPDEFMLPVNGPALTVRLPTVALPAPLMIPEPNNTLPPVILPFTLTVVPVNDVALTLAPPSMLPPVILPLVLTMPEPTSTLPPVMLPVTLTVVPVNDVALTLAPPNTLPPVMLPPVMLPVVLMGFEPRAAKLATTLALP